MRILDVDLDFFLENIAYYAPEDARLANEDDYYNPWPKDRVREFLEQQCLLSTKRPLPGAFVTEHSEVYDQWLRKIADGSLRTLFEVVHVDAHADLGLGDSGYDYLMTEWLERSPEERRCPRRGKSGLISGNYLLFAVACRWLSRLTYVHHPRGGNDLNIYCMKNNDLASGAVQLKYYGDVGHRLFCDIKEPPLHLEPEVPFEKISGDRYKAFHPFDMVFVAQSPTYTPREADALLDVFRPYVLV